MYDFSSAGTLLSDIPYEFDLTQQQAETWVKMTDLVSLLPQLYNDTSGYVVPDSLQYPILEELATLDHDIPGAWARNILIASGQMNYEEPVFSGSTLKASRIGKYHWTRSHPILGELNVFPNPAKDYIIVETGNTGKDATGRIRILDLHGRILKSGVLKKKENQQVIRVNDLVPGTYLIQLLMNGTVIETQKVVIFR